MKMSEEQYAEVRDEIGGYVTGCGEPVIRSAVELALDEYVRDIGGIIIFVRLAFGEGVFRIAAPFGGRVTNVRDVFDGGRRVNRLYYRTITDESGIAIVNLGHYASRKLTAQVEWSPSENTDELPTEWFSQSKGAIGNCALKRLLSQTTKPWGDAAGAAQFSSDYAGDVHDALYRLHTAGEDGNRISLFDRNDTFVPGGFDI